jgi:hypothetical protein
MLATAWPELQIVAECEHGPAAVEAIAQHQPDVAFLDIRMPGLSGLDVARAASGRCHWSSPPPTTATPWPRSRPARWTTCSSPSPPTAWPRPWAACASGCSPACSRTRPGAAGAASWRRSCSPRQGLGAAAALAQCQRGRHDQDVQHRRGAVFPERREVHAGGHRARRSPCAQAAARAAEGLDPELFWQVHRGVIVRASAIARAHRDELGRITLHLKRHAKRWR